MSTTPPEQPQDPWAAPAPHPGGGASPPPGQPPAGEPAYGAPPPGYGPPSGPPPGPPPYGQSYGQPQYGQQPYAQPPYGAPPGYHPQGYGYGPPGYPQSRGTNGFAIASLVCAFLCSPLGLVFGFVALSQIRQRGQEGRGLAIAGLILSGALLALGILLAVIGAAVSPDSNTFN